MNGYFSTERTSDKYLLLNSCGYLKYGDFDGICRRMSGRKDYHLLYITSGCCHVTEDGRTESAKEGSVVLYRPDEPQLYTFYAKEQSSYYYIHFTGTGCEEILKDLNMQDKRIFYAGKSMHLESLFDKLARESAMKLSAHEILCGGLTAEVLSLCARLIYMNESPSVLRKENLVSDACVMICRSYKTVTIESLAKSSYLSTGRFSHIFREITKKSPLEYIISVKLQKAKELLEASNLPVGSVASESGFNDSNYFCRVFKKNMGITPGEYRRSLKSETFPGK